MAESDNRVADFKIARYLQREGKVMEQMLAGNMAIMGLRDRGELLRKMRLTIRYQFGAVEALRFGTTRYGMIKLHGIPEGTIVHRRNSRGYALRGKQAQDWYSPVAQKMIPRMASGIARFRADTVIKASKVLNIDAKL